MSPRIAPMHVHCEFTTVECREPLLELCSGDNGSRLLNIEVKCSHLRAKTGHISGHLPTVPPTLFIKPSLTVVVKTRATETQAQSLLKEIRAMEGVKEVKYSSQEQAFNQFREKIKIIQ